MAVNRIGMSYAHLDYKAKIYLPGWDGAFSFSSAMHFLPPDRTNAFHLIYSIGLQLCPILYAGPTRVWHSSPIVELTTKEGCRHLNDIFDTKMFCVHPEHFQSS